MKIKSFLPLSFTALSLLAIQISAIAGTVIPPRSAPFDGGLTALVAAGIAYASKKAYDKRQKTKSVNREK